MGKLKKSFMEKRWKYKFGKWIKIIHGEVSNEKFKWFLK